MISKLKINLKNLEIKKLYKENKYFELQEKYYTYNTYYSNKIMKKDFELITGEKFNLKNRRKYKITRSNNFKQTTICLSAFFASSLLLTDALYYQTQAFSKAIFDSCYLTVNSIATADDVLEYDAKLKEDYSNLDITNMSDLEVIMRVIYDIRTNTYYDMCEYDDSKYGFNYRLNLNDENNHGVCRHIEDKFTAAMNSICPDYQAVNMIVNFDISIPFCKSFSNGKINEDHISIHVDDYDINAKGNRYGNHIVTVLKPREGDYYLVVDATNPSIGVLENGKIHMFNNNSTESIRYNPLGQYFLVSNGTNVKIGLDNMYSKNHSFDYNELDKEYGFDAQIKVLNKIK